MPTLHTFGCSITQGFALPDVVRTIKDPSGRVLTAEEICDQGIPWSDIHIYAPSEHAWPQVLADQINMPVVNHARRGACFQQIARQCTVAAPTIQPGDVVVVMWTYLSRLSLQWPARTAVPLCTVAHPTQGWRTVVLGFNRFFGLERSKASSHAADQRIEQYIEQATKNTYLDPMGVYDQYYRSLVLQVAVDGLLRSTGARVIHLSVEHEPVLEQLERARTQLDPSLREPYHIPNPADWYGLDVDYFTCLTILDPRIPMAENHMHPSVLHHKLFAQEVRNRYFSG